MSSKKPVKFDFGLEGLRGVLAILVGLSHALIPYLLDPGYYPDIYWLNVGQIAVLTFFIISGYVIGLTNQKEYSHSRANQYLLKRVIRLIPIYIIAVILGILARPEASFAKVIGNLFLLQNIFVPRLDGNNPVWTLNYEVVYYLLFIPIWAFRIKLRYCFSFCIFLSILAWFVFEPSIIFSYASGFIFWLFGLWLSWRTQSNHYPVKIPLLSYLLLIYVNSSLNFGQIVMNLLGYKGVSVGQVSMIDIINAFCLSVVIVSLVTRREFPALKWINLICFLMPVVVMLILLATGRILEPRWIPSIILYSLAIATYQWKIDLEFLIKFKLIGSVSYAFYLIHTPVLFFIRDYSSFSGDVFTYFIRFLIWLLISISVSIFLELVMQPAIKNKLYHLFSLNKAA
ncbi:acyltransferase family protein [Dulcicalothrix desertica]|nr:acyltransferase [Dulcicalothrix desertica]